MGRDNIWGGSHPIPLYSSSTATGSRLDSGVDISSASETRGVSIYVFYDYEQTSVFLDELVQIVYVLRQWLNKYI